MKIIIKTKLGTYQTQEGETEDGFRMLSNLIVCNDPSSQYEITSALGSKVLLPISVLRESVIILRKSEDELSPIHGLEN